MSSGIIFTLEKESGGLFGGGGCKGEPDDGVGALLLGAQPRGHAPVEVGHCGAHGRGVRPAGVHHREVHPGHLARQVLRHHHLTPFVLGVRFGAVERIHF